MSQITEPPEPSASLAYLRQQSASSSLSETLTVLPSYVARGLVYLILLFLIIFLVYASISRVDIHITAPARLIPEGKAALIQPDIEGILTQLAVHEGDAVVEGQVLALVESRDVSTYLLALQTAEAELADAQKESQQIAPLKIRQQATRIQILQDKIAHLDRSRATLERRQAQEETNSRLAQETFELDRYKQDEALQRLQVESQSAERTYALWKRELEVNRQLHNTGVVSELQLVLTRRSYEEAAAAVKKVQSQLRDTTSERQLLQKRYERTQLEHERAVLDLHEQLEQNRFDLQSARQEIGQREDDKRLLTEEAARKLALASARHQQARETAQLSLRSLDPQTRADVAQGKGSATNRAVITAPVRGRIAHLLVRNQGEAVRRGQTIMTLLPNGAPLVAQIQIANRDIGQVEKGQEVRFKFDAFPFAEHGVLRGELTNVLPDADPGQGETTYQAYAKLERAYFRVQGKEVELLSGMTATAEIVSERKTILELLLKPFKELQEPKAAEP
jgi:hemolysin D